MIRIKFHKDGTEVGTASVFGGRVVTTSGETPGFVVGALEEEIIQAVDSPPHGYSVEVVHDDASMHDQALFRRPR